MARMPKTAKRGAPRQEPHPLRLEWWEANSLSDNPLNWRRHPTNQFNALRDVIAEVGWAGALLYNERTKRLIDGHLRKKIGKGKIPVLVGSWSLEQETKILATLDPIASMAEANRDALEALLREVQTGSEAVGALLTELAQSNGISSLAAGPVADDPGPQMDRAEELQKKWGVRTGDLWLISSKTVPLRKIVKCPCCGEETELE